MLEKTESTESKILEVLHFIKNEEESESNIAKFKELLLGLGGIVHELRMGFKRAKFMSLVGFCFLQQELKMELVDCILEIAPDLLASVESFKTLEYTYDLADRGENGYSLQAISPYECWHLHVAPLAIAAMGDEGLSKIKLILEHEKYLDGVQTDAGYIAFVSSYILVIKKLIGREDGHAILTILDAESERLALSLGEQGNIGLLKKCLKMAHYDLKEIDSAEACKKICDEVSAIIDNFEREYRFIASTADVVLRDVGMFYSLAGLCFSEKFKPKFLNCILDVAPKLLMSEGCTFKYPSFMNYGSHPWGIWERIRLIEDPVWFRDGYYYSPIINAVLSKDLLQVTTILDHPIIAERAATHRWEVLEWKFKNYVWSCSFIWKQTDTSCVKILDAFKFAEMLKEARNLGLAGEEKIFENMQRVFDQFIEREKGYAVKGRMATEIMRPLKEAFDMGIMIRKNPRTQALLILSFKHSVIRACEPASTALTNTSISRKANQTDGILNSDAVVPIDEAKLASPLQYIGGALMVGLSGCAVLKYLSRGDNDISLPH
ncbi:MAG: hypothetical protein LW825_02710 [Candidatus Jidaibacter sp.]|jgi:hypothetical protein|nr:hypothetical protein [Candidatus Jidaibacter sp.]